jgi:Ca2+-dependent lipid-binding protein
MSIIFELRYNEGAKKTRKKLRTLNPVFQEIFSFILEEDDILETKVCIDLYDHDLVGSDDFMGQAVVDISSLNLSNELTYSEWFMLQQQVL